MDILEVKSSSEEDDDSYLNSVAKLKALKQRATLPPSKSQIENKDEKKAEEDIRIVDVPKILPLVLPVEPVVTQRITRSSRGRETRSRPQTRRRKQQNVPQGLNVSQDSDLEIVSVQEQPKSIENDVTLTEELPAEQSIDSCEDENYDICIKILWQSTNVHRLNIRQNENFRQIFEYFSKIEQVPIDEILITKKDRIIKKSDTPASLNLSVIDILEGGIIKKDSTMSQKVDEDVCIIKVQTTSKKSLTIPVKRDEDFKALLAKCAEELNTEESKIRLHFDGELIAVTDTPDSLDIEDEACFDLRISS